MRSDVSDFAEPEPEMVGLTSETFAPRRLAVLIGDIVEARYPARPIDCGV
jgi:hypothetical protein